MKRPKAIPIPLLTGAVFFLLGCVVLWGATKPVGQEAPFFGDALVTSSIGDARNLIPILASDTSSAAICSLVFNGLVKYDKHVRIVGDLAESWDILDGGLVIVFHLRPNVRWHDGEPFTAHDVAFTYRKLIDPAVRTPYSGDFERIRSLDVIDEHTVRVTYKEPFAPALGSWVMPIMPRHLLEHEDLHKTAFSRHPVGTGPFIFTRWKTGEVIELAANRDYFDGATRIGRYIYRIIPDEATTFLELETEGIDLVGLTPLQYRRQTDTPFFRGRYRKYTYPGSGFVYLGYNLLDPKFSDRAVREALNYAVDKEAIARTIFFGLARVTTGPYLMDSWAYDPGVTPAPFDPGRARSLLAAAGWTDADRDGVIEKAGQRFEFTLLVNQGNTERLRAAELIQRYLAAIGVRMKIRVLEWSVLINEYIDKKRFEAIILGWSLSRDPDNYDIWHSSKTREGEFNFISYRNEEVDRLLVEGRRTFDQAARETIYRTIHRRIYADQPYMFLYAAESLPIVHRRFRNVEVSPIGIGYNINTWFVPPAEQRYRKTAIAPS